MLVVLDNARSARHVRPLLPGSGRCFVLISSRSKLDDLVAHDGARLLTLDPLGLGEAGELLGKTVGDGRVDPATAEQIAVLCGRLPLALRIAAARLAMHPHNPASDLAGRLADEQRRLQELSRTPGGVRVSFGLSYRELPAQAAVLFRHIGLLDATDFAAWAAAALLGEPEQQAEDRLEELVRAGLIDTAGVDCAGQLRYRLHDLMRLYARERCLADDAPEVRDQALRRLFGAALHLASQADRSLGIPWIYPLYGGSPRYEVDGMVSSRVQDRPVLWLEAERNLLTNTVRRAARLGEASYAWELTSALSQHFSTSRHLDAWRECIDTALSAAKTAGDNRGEAAMLLQRADRQLDVGRASEAALNLQRALSLLSRCGDGYGQAICWSTLAACHRELGQLARSRGAALQALTLLGASTPQAVRCRVLITLGLTLLDQGRYVDAAGCFRRVVRTQRAAGSVRGLAEARYHLATVHMKQGRHAAAMRLLTSAMSTSKQSGDRMRSMVAQIRLGQTLIELGKLDQAHPLLDDARRRLACENSPRFRAIVLEALGHLYTARGQEEEAAPLIAEAHLLRRALPANAPR